MEGICTICKLNNSGVNGGMPRERLEPITNAYYEELMVGVTRAYAAMGAKQKIDKLVRCFNVMLPADAEYVLMDDGNQYRISLKQGNGDHVDLTLERLGGLLDVYAE